MNFFLKTILFTVFGTTASSAFAITCNDLATGKTVEDHFSSGKIKKLQSLEALPSEYGDSSPMPTVLIKKSAIKAEDVSKLTMEIFLHKGKQKQLFNKLTVVEEWNENSQYYFFKDYDSEKLNQQVFVIESVGSVDHGLKGASIVEVQLKLNNKVVCKKTDARR